jgi:putative ABC transport system permease protein
VSEIGRAFRFARRELRGGIAGFRVFLGALALGVTAIAGVGTIAAAISAGLGSEARTMLGGDLAVRLVHRAANPDELAYLQRTGDVSRAVLLRAIARVPGTERSALVELKAVDRAYPLYGAFQLDPAMPLSDALASADGAHGAVVDQSLLDRLGLKRGDIIEVGAARFRIAATIAVEPDRLAGGRTINLGPRFLASDDALAATDLIKPGSLTTYLYRLRLPPTAAIPDVIEDLRRAFPSAGWIVQDTTQDTPFVSRFVDRTVLFLTVVGLTALLVGGVGVGNAVRHYLGTKTESIATLKCLGSSASLIFAVYLIQIMVMAIGGTLAGLIVGGLAPALFAPTIAREFGLAIEIGVYALPLIVAAAFGLLTALTFTIWPVARACEVPAARLFRDVLARHRPPRAIYVAATGIVAVSLAALAIYAAPDRRLAMWFVGGALAAMVVFRIAGQAAEYAARLMPSFGSARLRLAFANLHRPGAATAGVVMSLGLGVTVLVAVALIEANIGRQIAESLPQRAPAFYFIDIQPDQANAFEAAARSIPGVEEIRRTPMLRGRISAVNGVPVEQANITPRAQWVLDSDRGITWSAEPPPGTRIVAGNWWPADYRGEPLVSFDASTAAGFGVGVGDTITVNILGRDITARIANLRRIEWGTLGMNFLMVFSPGLIEGAPQTELATVRATEAAETPLERTVSAKFVNVTPIRVREVLANIAETLEKIAAAIRVAAAVTVAAGVLVLAGAIAAGQRRRTYESVVLKVLGATRAKVLAVHAIEYGVLGLITAVAAAGAGTLAAWAVVTQIMRLEWAFLPGPAIGTALVALVLTMAAGLTGTWLALGRKALPYLRNP